MYNLTDVENYSISRNPEGIILDTNLLLLLLIGNYESSFIKYCAVTEKYSVDDLDLLKRILELFRKVVITPQVIAELSNMSITKGQMFGPKLMLYVQKVVEFFKLEKTEERYQELDCLWGAEIKMICDFGLTDLTMFALAKQTNMPILTDEMPLSAYLMSQGAPVVYFQYIRNSDLQQALR